MHSLTFNSSFMTNRLTLISEYKMAKHQLCKLLVLLIMATWTIVRVSGQAMYGQTLTVTSLPDALFMSNNGVHDIVEGSVIQLYCSVESTTAIFTWMLNNNPMVIDIPHLHVRTCNDSTSTTTVLTVENFGASDNGTYQCTAEDDGMTGSCNEVNLTAISSTPDGTILIRQQPVDNEVRFESSSSILGRNRSAISIGATVDPDTTPDGDKLLRCVAGHQGDDAMDYTVPTMVWIKNGQVMEERGDITITQASKTNGELSSILQITNFQLSNAGVYQCIFTDSDGEVITSTPYCLDTGEVLSLERVSPEIIILRPPEKLVIEVKASGRYRRINWDRNGTQFSPSSSSLFFVNVFEELPHYNEIFVREPTTGYDLGVYKVAVLGYSYSQTHPGKVCFSVISPVDANTTASTISDRTVIVVEGASVNISCFSTGVPVPTITWEFNGTSTSFEQSDTQIDVRSKFVRSDQNKLTSPLVAVVDPGNITSVLHIVNTHYPEHDGVYTCIGVNSEDGLFSSSSAIITVEVQVIPEINLTSNFLNNRINVGGTITLTCDVTRAVPLPMMSDVSWTFVGENENIVISERTSSLVVSNVTVDQLGTYVCSVTNSAGVGSGNITIQQGFSPSVTVVQHDPVVVKTAVELICIVAGDTPFNITWTRDSADGGTPELVFTGNDTTGGNFTLTVNIDDYGNYTCTATNVLGTDTGTVTIVLAAPPITIMVNKGLSTPTVGENYVLTINVHVSGADQINPIITYQWFKINHETQVLVGTNSSTLSFTPLRLSDAGQYRCDVTVSSRFLSDDIVQSSKAQSIIESVFIQLRMNGIPNCHEWALTDTAAKINDVIATVVEAVEEECRCGFSRGLHITQDAFECFPESQTHVTFRAKLSNTSKASTARLISHIEQWLCSTTKITVQKFRLRINTTCSLVITNFNDPECSPRVQDNITAIQSKEIFQLKFGSTEHCITWNSNEANEVQSDIHKAILQALTSRCQCTISQDNILNGVFSCQDSQDQTTYRSTIAGTQSHNATELVEFIQDWVHSKPTMTIQWYTVKIDHTCPVPIASLDEPECGIDVNKLICIARCTA